jgi:hypothetical protein
VLDTGGPGLASLSRSSLQVGEGPEIEPNPEPAPFPVPCHVQAVPIDQVEVQAKAGGGANVSPSAAAAAGSCPPVTLTSNNTPWQICAGGVFCIPRPLTEQELLASHHASPPGTKRRIR